MTISHLISMGGYGTYVWTAYGITLFVLGSHFLLSWIQKKRVNQLINQHHEQ